MTVTETRKMSGNLEEQAFAAISTVIEDASSMAYERNSQDYSELGEPSCYIEARKAVEYLRAHLASARKALEEIRTRGP